MVRVMVCDGQGEVYGQGEVSWSGVMVRDGQGEGVSWSG